MEENKEQIESNSTPEPTGAAEEHEGEGGPTTDKVTDDTLKTDIGTDEGGSDDKENTVISERSGKETETASQTDVSNFQSEEILAKKLESVESDVSFLKKRNATLESHLCHMAVMLKSSNIETIEIDGEKVRNKNIYIYTLSLKTY